MVVQDVAGSSPSVDQAPVETGLDVQIANELIEKDRQQGVSLVGEGGLLAGIIKTVLQTAQTQRWLSIGAMTRVRRLQSIGPQGHDVLAERASDLSLLLHSSAVTATLNKTFNRAARLVIDLSLSEFNLDAVKIVYQVR